MLIFPVPLCLPSGISAPCPDVRGPPDTSDDPGSLAQASILASDLNDFTDVNYDTAPEILLSAVSVNPEYVYEDDDNFPDEDAPLGNVDLEDEGDQTTALKPLVSDSTKDDHDPFIVEP